MKKSLFLLAITAVLLGLIGCEPNVEVEEPSVRINPDSLSLFVGQKDTLEAIITPDSMVHVVIWETSEKSVAAVTTEGVVIAKSDGEAIITVTTDFGSATCVVTVASGVLEIDVDNYECYVYDTKQLVVTKPDHKATARVTWKSSNKKVANVDSKGNVTALASGTAVITASVSGCKAVECTVKVNDVELAYPRKFLIEHFTGEACGYCPGGMYAIVEHIEDAATPYIWVSHHYGFGVDEYTIPENSAIGEALGVQGAPNMALNRSEQEVGLAFHPGYLPDITISDKTSAAMSVEIDHAYNAATRQLDVMVSGQSSFVSDSKYLLTVLIKENRLVGQQADYVYSWQTSPWKEYMHARVVRDVITKEFGDTITMTNQSYSKKWSYTLNDNWVAENCCVVAYLTPISKMPIINAEQVVLVEGTTGGEEYMPYGITEGKGPNTQITFTAIDVEKVEDEDLLVVQLTSSQSITTAYGAANPVAMVYVNTDKATLEEGTYPIQVDGAMNSITAGYRIDELTSFGGSLLIYAVTSYLDHGMVAAAHVWRINEGEMVVDKDGNITFDFKTYGGTSVKTTYTHSGTGNLINKKHISGDMILLDRAKYSSKVVLSK